MPKRDVDLFERLRRAGVRKQVAKRLSELGEDAGQKAAHAGHTAVAELRALAEEIQQRLPAVPSSSRPRAAGAASSAPGRRKPAARAKPAAARAKPTAARAKPATSRAKPATAVAKPAASRAKPATSQPASATSRAPRGENKAKILASLKAGPRTASEVSRDTGIGTGTVSATLTKLAKSGEVAKASRGYALPTK